MKLLVTERVDVRGKGMVRVCGFPETVLVAVDHPNLSLHLHFTPKEAIVVACALITVVAAVRRADNEQAEVICLNKGA